MARTTAYGMSASEANSTGVRCKYGHTGMWRDQAQHVRPGTRRVCRSCEAAWARRKNYGITIAQHDALLAKQGNRCAICDKHAKLVVDHRHEDGRIRGLLCAGCNLTIGMIENHLELLAKIEEYLK